MANSRTSKRPRGPQEPGKYPIAVGSNYIRWGEQPGFIYNPWSDKYIPDPKLQEEYARKYGLEKKGPAKPPSSWEVGAAATVPQLVSSLGLLAFKNYLEDSPTSKVDTDKVGEGLLGIGSDVPDLSSSNWQFDARLDAPATDLELNYTPNFDITPSAEIPDYSSTTPDYSATLDVPEYNPSFDYGDTTSTDLGLEDNSGGFWDWLGNGASDFGNWVYGLFY